MIDDIQSGYKFREGKLDEDGIFADCFYDMWTDMGIASENLQPEWRDITLGFIREARIKHHLKWFLAEDAKGAVSVAGGHLHSPYPNVFKEKFRRNGLIWGVYTRPEHRKKGLAKKLTLTVIDYLQEIGCTRVRLHASPMGRPVYESLGFVSTSEMERLIVK